MKIRDKLVAPSLELQVCVCVCCVCICVSVCVRACACVHTYSILPAHSHQNVYRKTSVSPVWVGRNKQGGFACWLY